MIRTAIVASKSACNVGSLARTSSSPPPIFGRYLAPTRSSFRALLNGVDVTSLFHPGPADGADLAAVFELGAGKPLIVGTNTLKTFVTGLPSTFGPNIIPSLIDTDTIIFTVVLTP